MEVKRAGDLAFMCDELATEVFHHSPDFRQCTIVRMHSFFFLLFLPSNVLILRLAPYCQSCHGGGRWGCTHDLTWRGHMTTDPISLQSRDGARRVPALLAGGAPGGGQKGGGICPVCSCGREYCHGLIGSLGMTVECG